MIGLVPSAHGGTFAAPTTGPRAEIEFLQQQLQALVPALLEVVRANTELARTVVSKFPDMMESAAVLVRAASDAGISRTEPLAEPHAAEARRPRSPKPSAKGHPSATTTLDAVVTQVLPAVVAAFAAGRPDAVPVATAEDAQAPSLSAAAPVQHGAEVTVLAEREHFAAVSAELAPTERALMYALAEELEPPHRRAWLQSLQRLSVPAAVTQVRSLLEMPSSSAEATAVTPYLAPLEDAPRSSSALLPSLLRNVGALFWPGDASPLGLLRWGSPRDARGVGGRVEPRNPEPGRDRQKVASVGTAG
jgi:hypothetical protein